MKRKIDKNKVYQFIGRAFIYSTLYITAVVFSYFALLQGTTY